MQVTPIINSANTNEKVKKLEPSFEHGNESFWKSDYSTKDKLIVAGTTALGVAGSLAVLAKRQGHSLKPKSFFNYLKNTKILCKEVVSMGIGTCLGGLAGGYIIDKNPENRKAKRREAVMQIGNISIPILTVDLADKLCNKCNVKNKGVKAVSSLGAIVAGIYIANFAMNKLSNVLFKNKSEERGVKGTDLFPHVDDLLASGQYIAPNSKLIAKVSRIVPLALMVPGNERGNKKAD